MKRNYASIIIALLVTVAYYTANSQSLTIIDQDYEKAVKESKQQNKLLLIDFYTTWCVPCKYLDKVIFQDTIISNELSKQFILLKYNAEKDSIHQLSLKHHIGFYPTTMVLNQQEMVLNRLYGFGGEEKDLVKNYKDLLQQAITRNNTKEWIKGVTAGTHLSYPEFYKQFVYRTNTKNSKENVEKYWQTLPEDQYFDEVPFAILCYFNGGSDKINTFFFDNRRKYEALYGELDTRFIVSMLLSDKAYTAIDKKDRVQFDKTILLAKQHLSKENATAFTDQMEEKMLQKENKWNQAAANFSRRKSEPGFNERSTFYFSRAAAEQCTDKQVLKKCTAWMKEVITKDTSYDFMDTYAKLLFKTGSKKKAIATMEKAISAGKQQKEDTRSSEEWLLKNK